MKLSAIRSRLEKRLKELSTELTQQQITVIAAKTANSYNTVRNYLSGQCPNIETAEAIVEAADFELSNN